jgi:hypothetical protein
MNNETYRTLGLAYKYVSETDLELLEDAQPDEHGVF